MRQRSEAGKRTIGDLAQRYGFSPDAVVSMLESVVSGNGTMAQFSHPEFGGSGQWMRGGMIMVSDMFNNSLKSRIDGLCNELSALVANEDDLITSGSFQSQSQGGLRQGAFGGGHQQQSGSGPVGRVSLFVPPPRWQLWPLVAGRSWPTHQHRRPEQRSLCLFCTDPASGNRSQRQGNCLRHA
jgi:hypothetical protein